MASKAQSSATSAEGGKDKKTINLKEKLFKKFQEISKVKYFSGVGRRKRAIARVRLIKGTGKIYINGGKFLEYFADDKFAGKFIQYPLELTGLSKKFDISAKVNGSGKNSQKEAVRLGIARALVKYDESLRTTLKKSDLLTRDPRKKERRKYGLKKARRAPQWSKR